jgi:tripartite-type tricarboxylate transporter receptor subunit TctC
MNSKTRIQPSRRGALAASVGLVAAMVVGTAQVQAQAFPNKPIRIIITLSAGSASDSVTRVVGEQVSKQVGQPVVFENRPGGGGTIGAGAVAKSDPDGYTLLVNTNLHTLAPSIMANVPYDVENDFAGIALLGISPHVLIISSSQGFKTLKDFVDAARKKPDGITYASVVGSGTHLNGAHFVQKMNLNARMVPFKGAPEAITEVMTGRVDIYFSPILPTMSLINDGKLYGLGVTSPKRSAVMPNLPTTVEAGYPDSNFGLMFGLFAPGQTPRPIVDKLHSEVATALRTPSVVERLKSMGVDSDPKIMSPKEFDAYIVAQMKTEAVQAAAAGLSKK